MRADVFLASFGYAKSRSAAQSMISEGSVIINGKRIEKASENIDENAENNVEITAKQKFVGRGGYKLEYALEKFGIDVKGMTAIDVGASTGGFTDCLLQRGAGRVFAVDSGAGQLDASLVSDPRVVNIEKYNARNLKITDFDSKIDIAVMDVSFISQTLIIPSLSELLPDGAWFVSLIKPQFEAGREFVGKKGVVKDKKVHYDVIVRVCEQMMAKGLSLLDLDFSPIKGPEGNIEYLLYMTKRQEPSMDYLKKAKEITEQSHTTLD